MVVVNGKCRKGKKKKNVVAPADRLVPCEQLNEAKKREGDGCKRKEAGKGRDSPIDLCSVAVALVASWRRGSRRCHVE